MFAHITRVCCETEEILNGKEAYQSRDDGTLYSVDSPRAFHMSSFEDAYVYALTDEEFLNDDQYSDLEWYDLVYITKQGKIKYKD